MNHNNCGNDGCEGSSCCTSAGKFGVSQNLLEMEFERGIWSAGNSSIKKKHYFIEFNYVTANNLNLKFASAQDNELDKVMKFLEKGVSPSVVDAAGYNSLHYAARNGHLEICKLLLQRGIEVDAATRAGRATALQRAASQSRTEIVKLLLERGANPNAQDADGYTALHRAILAGATLVRELLTKVTDVRLKDNKGRTAIDLAHEIKVPTI